MKLLLRVLAFLVLLVSLEGRLLGQWPVERLNAEIELESLLCVHATLGIPRGDLDGDGHVAFEDFLAMMTNDGQAADLYSEGETNPDGGGFRHPHTLEQFRAVRGGPNAGTGGPRDGDGAWYRFADVSPPRRADGVRSASLCATESRE